MFLIANTCVFFHLSYIHRQYIREYIIIYILCCVYVCINSSIVISSIRVSTGMGCINGMDGYTNAS